MPKYEIQYQSIFFGDWIPLFANGTQYDSYTEALRSYTNHITAMLDSDEGDDIDLADYRIMEVENA